MENKNNTLDIEIEQKIIGLLLIDKEILKKWEKQNVKISYFNKQFQNILKAIQKGIVEQVSLTVLSYSEFCKSYLKLNHSECVSENNIFNSCKLKAALPDDFPVLLQKVKENHLLRETNRILSNYNKERQQTDIIKANKSLKNALSDIEIGEEEATAEFIEIHKSKDSFMERLYKRRNNPDSRLTCGIPEIDQTMSVGFKPGHLTMFCAEVGTFKTSMMVNVALNIFKINKEKANIMYIPLEMPAEEIMNKIISRETQVPLRMIEHAHELSEDQIKKISEELEKWKDLGNRFSILDPMSRTKVSEIRREIERRLDYFQPQVIFVDYVDNLLPDNQRSRSDEQMNDTLENLRKMGKNYGFSIVTAAQLGRDAIKKMRDSKDPSANSTSIRGGQVMSANSDTVYAQWRDPSNPFENLIFTCIKARHGQTMFSNRSDKTVLKVRADICSITSASEDSSLNAWKNNMTVSTMQAISAPPPISLGSITDEAPF